MNNDTYNPVPHDAAFVEKLLSNPEVRSEYERIENDAVNNIEMNQPDVKHV